LLNREETSSSMKHTNDVEKDLKDRVQELADADSAASAAEVRLLLDRCKSYRDRLRDREHKNNEKMAPLQSELAEHRFFLAWAHRKLDPEMRGTGRSVMDVYDTAFFLKEIEKRRGHVIASRLIYGEAMPSELAHETLGALQAGIDEALAEQQRWIKYREGAQERERGVRLRLKKKLAQWHDWDGAAYELGIALGIFDAEKHPFQTKTKHVFWTNNPVGNALHDCLNRLVSAGVLERQEPDSGDIQFRWNPSFEGSWEG